MGLEADVFDAAVTKEEREHWLRVFAAMFSRTAFERTAKDAPSFHDRARREAAFYEERVAKNLSDLVFENLYPSLGKAIADKASADTDLDEIRNATLILLYRLLFILYAEDRGLLPVTDKRYDDYALREARKDVGKRMDAGDTFSGVATPIWDRFSSLATMIDKGDPSVGLPPYNGGLFSAVQTPLLNDIRLPDSVMAEALDILSYEQRDGLRRYINYRDLSVQQLGSIYERLLEFEMKRVDGEFEVLPNIFARKDSGSYYTPDELVLLIIDETLQPLIDDAYAAFAKAIGQIGSNDNEASMLRVLEGADPAKAITRLRVCDPAMGSGHFLVSLVDRMTNQALEAMARAVEIAAEAGIGDYQSPVAREIESIRSTIWHNAQDKAWAIAEEQLDDPQLVKRMVLKRCVHGVDKNPMAVELAKVALWLHTFTVGAPLSFIDHHLHCGDSLFGMWVRDAMNKGGEGVALFLHEPLQRAQTQARVMQTIEALTDAEIAEATQSAEMWDGVEAQIGELDGFVKFIHALDWLDITDLREKTAVRALLAGQFGDPIAIMRGREEPFAKSTQFQASGSKDRIRAQGFEASELVDCIKDTVSRARQLINEERFLNWQIAFPGVWQNWASAGREGGFDAVIGNPPWDRFEFEEVPWFKNRAPSVALQRTSAARKKAVRALEKENDPLVAEYHFASERIKSASAVVRKKSNYSLANNGKLNLYKLFAERALQLIKPDGIVGILVPSGIAGDKSSSKFFARISQTDNLRCLYDFENSPDLFPDVHQSQKFSVIVFSDARRFASCQMVFYAASADAIRSGDGVLQVSSSAFARMNPNTENAPLLRSQRDYDLLDVIYRGSPVLHQHEEGSEPIFPIVYRQMINMSSDSEHFKTEEDLTEEIGAWRSENSEFTDGSIQWKPLYQGRMIWIYDHRLNGVGFNPENPQRPYFSIPTTVEEHKDPAFAPPVHSWIPTSLIPSEWHHTHILYRRSVAVTNMRTMVSCLGPKVGYGDSVFLLIADPEKITEDTTRLLALLQANLATIPLDFVARNKVQGQNFSWFIVEQLPVIPPAAYDRSFGPKSAGEIVREAVLELTYTAHDMAAFARDMGHVDAAGELLPPFPWDEERRLHARAKLDALYFILYGIYDPDNAAQSREDIRYIYSTFPIVERQETAAWGSYRSRDLALAWINALMAGQPCAEVVG